MYQFSILIPFLNEEDNIEFLCKSLDIFFENKNLRLEIIFIDDGSTDNSYQILSDYKFRNVQAKIIKFSKNYGSHAALRAGILHAKGDYISFCYADLQDPLELQIRMYEICKNLKADIVWANRKSTNLSFGTKIFSEFYAKLMKKYAFKDFPEKGFDVCMFNKKVAIELNKNIESNSSIFLQILGLGFKQTYIEYDKLERKKGNSKWTLQKKIKLFIDSFVAFSYAPIRFVSILGITFFFFGIIYSIYLLIRSIFIGDLSPGWPMLISILMLGFGLTNISLGIIAEYLWRTLDASRNRPLFVIDEILELTNENITSNNT